MADMTIGELAKRSGLPVRTLRFYADAGVLPEAGRTRAGYRLFAPEAVARARLLRTLRELGIGLDEVRRVLDAEVSLGEVARRHVDALDAQIRTLRLRRAVLGAVAVTTNAEELEQMTDLTKLTNTERRQIVEDYLDAVFGDDPDAVGDAMAMGALEMPDDPTPEQITAWVELAGLLRDPGFIASSRRMAQWAKAEGPEPDVAQIEVGRAVGTLAGPAARAGLDPASPEALEIVERLEGVAPPTAERRSTRATRIETFADRRVGRYWTLVGIVNDWAPSTAPADIVDAWEWYAAALRAHA